MRKQLAALALGLLMLLTLLPAAALAAESDFLIDEKGVLTRYNGSGGDVVIPDGVTGIGTDAFHGCTSLTSAVIPSGVTSIGKQAFARCKSLTSVTIPDSVTGIGEGAFLNCTGLAGVTIPGSVTSIGNYAFYDCDSLTVVTIGNGVTVIGNHAFTGCEGLTVVTLPGSVTGIGDRAFSNCGGLTSVTIPSSVTSIGGWAFYRCFSLTDVYYSGAEEQWRAIEILDGNARLQSAAIHYNSSMPGEAAAPVVNVACPSTQSVEVDGRAVEFQMYALMDEDNRPVNYVKLRDVASVLNGTAAQFGVDWDGAVNVETGKAYVPNGSEMSVPFSGERPYTLPANPTSVNGAASGLQAIVLTDDAGGGYTYYELRDLGEALGFNVGWSAGKGVYIETDKPYDPTN